MKIIVYGTNGWIGKQFVEILKNNNMDFVCGKSRADNNELLISFCVCVSGVNPCKLGVYNTIIYKIILIFKIFEE